MAWKKIVDDNLISIDKSFFLISEAIILKYTNISIIIAPIVVEIPRFFAWIETDSGK